MSRKKHISLGLKHRRPCSRVSHAPHSTTANVVCHTRRLLVDSGGRLRIERGSAAYSHFRECRRPKCVHAMTSSECQSQDLFLSSTLPVLTFCTLLQSLRSHFNSSTLLGGLEVLKAQLDVLNIGQGRNQQAVRLYCYGFLLSMKDSEYNHCSKVYLTVIYAMEWLRSHRLS